MIEKTAYFLGQNGEEPNIALAVELCETNDKDGIKEIVQALSVLSYRRDHLTEAQKKRVDKLIRQIDMNKYAR